MSLPLVIGPAVTGADCTVPLMTNAVEASAASSGLVPDVRVRAVGPPDPPPGRVGTGERRLRDVLGVPLVAGQRVRQPHHDRSPAPHEVPELVVRLAPHLHLLA